MEVGWGWAPKTFSEEGGRWIKERLLKWAQSPGIKGENKKKINKTQIEKDYYLQ